MEKHTSIESTKNQMFSVEFDGEHYRTVYPEPLSELCNSFHDETSAWADLVMNRVGHTHGEKWTLHGMTDAAHLLWDLLGDTPIDECECLDEPFLHFEKGTDRFDVWHWFEEYFGLSIKEEFATNVKENQTSARCEQGIGEAFSPVDTVTD
ncbi:hypothetical protein [Alteromonas sp. 14N.309.X.WAT.G.H12]|uniref:hypothetical protein n=1 Tax=Alteromonas sp. 14N.309.X.WAT.G.H12 TaxID=3120824 RepID=UPI002FD74B5D